MLNILLKLFFLFLLIAGYVQCQTYTEIAMLHAANLQKFINPQSFIYVSTPTPRPKSRKTHRQRSRPAIEQYLKEVTPTTKTIFSEKTASTTEKHDKIITQREDTSHFDGRKHTSVIFPVYLVPQEYFSLKDDYTNVRSSNRKTNPYLPTGMRFQEIGPIKNLLDYKQNLDSTVVEEVKNENQKPRLQRAKEEDDVISHVVGYFSVSHAGIVPNSKNKEK